MTACLGDDTIAAMLEGQLADAVARDARLHVGNCDACRELVAAAIGAPPSSSITSITRPAHALGPGNLFADRYRVERVIGEGGMGRVVFARQLGLERDVAIKVLQPELARDEVALARFHREARLAASLDSQHVARIYDLGVVATGEPYLVMELLEGEDLGSIVARGPIGVERATRYITAACEALGEAHALGIVHRDIKPSNLFVTRGDRLVLLDFGLAKLTAFDASASVTHDGIVLGSPRYMAPEQIRGSRDVGPRADLWSLGATLYHLVTGTPPFPGTSIDVVFAQILEGPLPSVDGLPAPIARTLTRALARDPAQRFATAREFALSLTTRPADLDARFEVYELLGEGSHGTVYRARHRSGGGEVALKVLRDDAQQVRARFAREAAIVQRLEHPNTVRIYESGITTDGTPFMVFELVRGRTLAAELQRGPLLPIRVARVAAQVCKALIEAHARGIVHRDITPSNILLVDYAGDPDFVKLLDFGVAADVEAPNLTLTGQTLGTPRYMAPEQIMGSRVDGRADLYALGLVMAEALTGTPIVGGASVYETFMMQTSPDPLPLPTSITGGPFGETIVRATAKRPEDRFGSAAEMLAAIERGPRDVPRGSPIVERRPRSHIVPVLVGCIALLAVTIVLLAARPWASSSSSTAAPSAPDDAWNESRLRTRLSLIGWPPSEVTHDMWGRCNFMRTKQGPGMFNGHRREWGIVLLMTCDTVATADSEGKRFRASYPGSWTITNGRSVLLAYTTAPGSADADEASSKELAEVLLGAAVAAPSASPTSDAASLDATPDAAIDAAPDAAIDTAIGRPAPAASKPFVLDEKHIRVRLAALRWSPAEVTHQDFPGCRHTRFRLAEGTFLDQKHPWGEVLLLECESKAVAGSEAQRLHRGFPDATIILTNTMRVLMVSMDDKRAAKLFGDELIAP